MVKLAWWNLQLARSKPTSECCLHNHLDRVGGFAPSQWAYGRLPTFGGRYIEGGNHLPVHTTEGTMGTSLRANLNIRVKAEEQ